MEIKKHSGSIERRILIGLIVDSIFLGRIAQKWPLAVRRSEEQKGLFNSKWTNLVGSWCVRYFSKYGKAPGRQIEGIFENWANRYPNDDTIKLVEKFLSSLSNEYEELSHESNPEYLADVAAEHFNRVALHKLAEAIESDLDVGNLGEANKRVAVHSIVDINSEAGIDVLHDEEAIRRAFEEKKEPLITFHGALGRFFGDAFERDGFVAFMGPEKRGKTFWLLDIAWRAMLQRRKVAFFEVGDMSESQILRRFMTRAAKRPLKPRSIKVPTSLVIEDGKSELGYDEIEVKKRLSWQYAWKQCQKILRSKVKSTHSYLKLSCHANSTLSVRGMEEILRNWEREGWMPDIIVVDYADILAPINGQDETRHQINKTWMALRSLSQSLHCCVVTATQASAASYKSETMDRSHFSENKLKLAHCTGMVGINAKPEEKVDGIMRLNWIVLREEEFFESKCVTVAGCLALANPAMKSAE